MVNRLKKGGSIAVNGVCLTVLQKDNNYFTADLIKETRIRTNLGRMHKARRVNLELPVTSSTFLSGHIVQGHVDGTARLEEIVVKDGGRVLKFSLPRSLSKYIITKGSVAIDGISFTVIQAQPNYFTGSHRERPVLMHRDESMGFQISAAGGRSYSSKNARFDSPNALRFCAGIGRADVFTVGIIPHTWKSTAISDVHIGDSVNIEVDIMAKYVERLIKRNL